jgi:hypothetical protein
VLVGLAPHPGPWFFDLSSLRDRPAQYGESLGRDALAAERAGVLVDGRAAWANMLENLSVVSLASNA